MTSRRLKPMQARLPHVAPRHLVEQAELQPGVTWKVYQRRYQFVVELTAMGWPIGAPKRFPSLRVARGWAQVRWNTFLDAARWN